MILKGKLIKCKREVKEFKKGKSEEKLFITLSDVNISDDKMEELKEAFKDAGKQFTPDWIKNFEGYVNVSTKFELPVRLLDGNDCMSIEDAIADGLKFVGADVKMSINVKEGAVYPNAIVMLSEGAAFDPFAEFDNEEE